MITYALVCANKCAYPRQSQYYKRTTWILEARKKNRMIYYDSVTGKPLFNSGKCHGRNFEGASVVWVRVGVIEAVLRCLAS